MNSKRIGFLGFEGVAASELVRAADVLAAATLDGGYGNRISCYHVCTIGFTSECFHAESGIAFWPDRTLETASKLDTIVIPGGDGLRQSSVSEKIADWILARAGETRRVAVIGGGIYGVAPTGLLDGREVTTHWRYATMLHGVSRTCVLIPEGISLKTAPFTRLPVPARLSIFRLLGSNKTMAAM